MVYSFHHVGQHDAYGKKGTRGIEMLGGSAPKPPPNRQQNFDTCPGSAQDKEMPVPGGAWERWCVEVDGGGSLVDTGPYRKWYGSGKAWVVGQFEMGRRVGKWTTYGEDGSVSAEVDY